MTRLTNEERIRTLHEYGVSVTKSKNHEKDRAQLRCGENPILIINRATSESATRRLLNATIQLIQEGKIDPTKAKIYTFTRSRRGLQR